MDPSISDLHPHQSWNRVIVLLMLLRTTGCMLMLLILKDALDWPTMMSQGR